MYNKSDSQHCKQFQRNTPESKKAQVSSFVNGNYIADTISPRRQETLFKKLPSIDSSDDHWKIKRVGSDKLIQTQQLVKPQKATTPATFKKMTTMFSEEPSVFDLASSRQFVKKFTIKQKSSTKIKSSQEIQLKKSEFKPKQQVGQRDLYEKEKEKTSTCPFSSGSQGYLQQFFERSKNKNGATQRHSEFEQMEELDNQTRDFQMILRSDTLIGAVLGDAHEMKGVVKSVINLAYGNKLQYQYETLRNIHNSLGITDEMFNRFKSLYIKKLISMKSTVDDIFRCAQTVESYRGAITCNDNSVQDIKNHIRVVTKEMYTNIWADYSLSPLFSNAKFDEQVIKFSRIFGFILSTSETTNYVLDSMRDFHREMGITSVQYSIFKFYLSTALQSHIDANAVWYVLEQADCYKASVINQDSIKNLVYRTHGLENFINDFNKACLQDPFINKTFVTKMGLEQFQIHTRYFMQYIFNRHNTCFVLQDLQSLHQGVANSKLFQAYKLKFFQLIMKLNPHRVMISDFEEDFDLLEPYIAGKPLLCELVGDRIDGFLKQLCLEMKSDYEIVNLYETNDVKMEQNLKRMFNYMLSGRTYYKRSDIQAIHSRLYISEDMFMEFVSKCHRAIDATDPSLIWIIDVVREWKELIISKK